MIRGTTPTHIFKIPFAANLIQKVRVIYAQRVLIFLPKQTRPLFERYGVIV